MNSVVCETDSGKWLWGTLKVFPKQLELLFSDEQQDGDKTTYIFYESELAGIQRLYRPSPAEDSPERKSWEKELDKIARPSLFRRSKRKIFNSINTLRDAVSQSIGMILGTLKSKTAMGKISGADKRAGEISSTLLGTVPNAFEPILETYLSKKVVVEMIEEGAVVEYQGLLEEYSEHYLLVRDVLIHSSQSDHLSQRNDIIFPRKKALVRHRVV